MLDVVQQKQAARAGALARRDDIPQALREQKSASISSQLAAKLDRLLGSRQGGPVTMAVYAAMGTEPDPSAFYSHAERRGCRVAYPCMFSAAEAAASGQRMCMRAVAAGDASAAPFIAHPTRAFAAADIDSARFPIVPAEALDMIVVPLVAFDRTGARLGYGGGCYDRYLPALRPDCQIIGIAFDEQCISHVPTDAHDLLLPNIFSA